MGDIIIKVNIRFRLSGNLNLRWTIELREILALFLCLNERKYRYGRERRSKRREQSNHQRES